MTEKVEMNHASLKQAMELALYYYHCNIPCYFWGPPGVGKSDAMRQLAKLLEIGFIDVRLGSKLPEDLNGIPVPDTAKKKAIWLAADFWPQLDRDGPKGILLFDEMSDTSKAVQSTCYQVVLDRCIGEHKLLEGWWPCAAGNRRGDKAGAQAMSTALANRFAHVDIMADYDCWREYASQKKLNHFVVGFLKQHGSRLLHNMDGTDVRAFPSPRSWEQVCKIMDKMPTGHRALRTALVRGLVGPGAAAEFDSFMQGVNIPDLEEIIKAPKTCRIPEEPSSRYALTAMLEQCINKKNFDAINEYIMRPEFGRDFEIVTIMAATKRDVSLMNSKAYTDFAIRNKDLMVCA